MTVWQGIFLGLVQGLTEFLPVSSSGHLVLVEILTGIKLPGVFVEVMLHVATLGSLLFVFGGRLWSLLRSAARGEAEGWRAIWLLALGTLPAAVIGVAATVSGLRRTDPDGETASVARNPLQLRAALEMAIVFQVVLLLVAFIRGRYGAEGLLGTAIVVGLNDVDALTLSMAHEVSAAGIDPGLAARTVAVGLLSNTCVKLALAIGAGAPAFRKPTAVVLVLMALALLAGVLADGRL